MLSANVHAKRYLLLDLQKYRLAIIKKFPWLKLMLECAAQSTSIWAPSQRMQNWNLSTGAYCKWSK